MAELLKQWFTLLRKSHDLNYIDKQCDKYFKINSKLEVQRQFLNYLMDRYEKHYGESLRKPKKEVIK